MATGLHQHGQRNCGVDIINMRIGLQDQIDLINEFIALVQLVIGCMTAAGSGCNLLVERRDFPEPVVQCRYELTRL